MDYLQRNMLSQLACDRIKKYIVDQRLQPGDKLPTERDFADRLKVSRTVVREALNHLETLGMINKIQGKGIFITEQNLTSFFQQIVSVWETNPQSYDDLIDFRILLETAVLEQVAANAEEADYAELERIVADAQLPSTSGEQFVSLDFDFHKQLLRLARNELFLQLMKVVNDYFRIVQLELFEHARGGLQQELTIRSHREQTVRDHGELIRLLRARKLKEAKQLLRAHLLRAKR